LSRKNQGGEVKLLGRSDERGKALSGGDARLLPARVSAYCACERKRGRGKKWRG
jgi:hypothetical protein